jgi:hypothetical protein
LLSGADADFSASVAQWRNSSTFFGSLVEDDRILDMSILQILQGPSETVREYLSRLFQNATNKDIPEQVLLAVGINGLRPEIRQVASANWNVITLVILSWGISYKSTHC